MQPSADEAARALQAIDHQRRAVRRSLPGWPLALISLTLMAASGLIQDRAPRWSGAAFLLLGLIGLVIGLWGRTRHGSTTFGRLVQPRSLTQGAEVGSTSPARRLVVHGSYVALAVLAGIIVAYSTTHASGSTGTWWPGGWPHTIEMIAIWAAVCSIYVASRRWFTPDPTKS